MNLFRKKRRPAVGDRVLVSGYGISSREEAVVEAVTPSGEMVKVLGGWFKATVIDDYLTPGPQGDRDRMLNEAQAELFRLRAEHSRLASENRTLREDRDLAVERLGVASEINRNQKEQLEEAWAEIRKFQADVDRLGREADVNDKECDGLRREIRTADDIGRNVADGLRREIEELKQAHSFEEKRLANELSEAKAQAKRNHEYALAAIAKRDELKADLDATNGVLREIHAKVNEVAA